MNKTQLIDAIADRAEISKVAAKKAIDALISITGEALSKGEPVAIMGFGAFSVATRPAKTGRNWNTGAPIKIDATKVVKFRPGQELSSAVK